MRDHRPKSNVDLLISINGEIRQKAQQLALLDQEIKKILPLSAKYCRVANLRDGILIIECSSSSWATRLKYDKQNLLSALRRSSLPSLMTIEIKINPDLAQAELDRYRKIQHKEHVLSQRTADSLLSLASFSSEKIAKKLRDIAKLSQKKP